MATYKYLTKRELLAAAVLANKYGWEGFNLPVLNRLLDTHPEDTKYPVTLSFYHENSDTIRTKIVLNDQGVEGLLDIYPAVYEKLGTIEIQDVATEESPNA